MLDRLVIRNFKLFEEVSIDLGETVVLVGPNNAGKTSALQALALWELGVRRWSEKQAKVHGSKKRSGVAINRRDLVALPVPDTILLWRDRHVRESRQEEGKQRTSNIRMDIEVHGVTRGKRWSCGMEFDYANPESIYCRPLGWARGIISDQPPIPLEALEVQVAYLPPHVRPRRQRNTTGRRRNPGSTRRRANRRSPSEPVPRRDRERGPGPPVAATD